MFTVPPEFRRTDHIVKELAAATRTVIVFTVQSRYMTSGGASIVRSTMNLAARDDRSGCVVISLSLPRRRRPLYHSDHQRQHQEYAGNDQHDG